MTTPLHKARKRIVSAEEHEALKRVLAQIIANPELREFLTGDTALQNARRRIRALLFETGSWVPEAFRALEQALAIIDEESGASR